MFNLKTNITSSANSIKMNIADELITGISDAHLALIIPIVAYWTVSLLYHIIDTYDILPQYRSHLSAEVAKRNRVGRWECLRDVVGQQILQTAAGLLYIRFSPTEQTITPTAESSVKTLTLGVEHVQHAISPLLASLGLSSLQLAGWKTRLASMIYYILYPALQFGIAIFVIDTWQYFLHRLLHTSKWCCRTFHIRHHRLQAPYAYGALYNHPLEGFVGDTFGAGLAYHLSGMSTRQAMLLFALATVKTIDDHCGYDVPWDPLQRLTSNNAHYHDIHHQSWGMKTNFAQPFLTFWDDLLGTRWVDPKKVKYAVA
jgi:sphinganine C4-monooxygenase